MPEDMCKDAAPEAEGLISSERFADGRFCMESSSIKHGSIYITRADEQGEFTIWRSPYCPSFGRTD
jgi:hypothetical protein